MMHPMRQMIVAI
ncbi:hypothetical protein RDABS01_030912 [Bienertia sinuspersici]